MRLITIFAIIAAFVLIGCNSSNEPSSSQNIKDYMPQNAGTWWKYENYTYDSTETSRELTSVDSVVLNSVNKTGDTTVYNFTEHRVDSASPPVSYSYKVIDNKAYTNNAIPMLSNFIDASLLLADLTLDEWEALPLNGIEFEIFGFSIKGDYWADGFKDDIMPLNVNKTKLDCQKVHYDFSFDGMLEMPDLPIPVPTEISSSSAVWLGYKTGIVKTVNEAVVAEAAGFDFNIANKTEQILVDFHINKD